VGHKLCGREGEKEMEEARQAPVQWRVGDCTRHFASGDIWLSRAKKITMAAWGLRWTMTRVAQTLNVEWSLGQPFLLMQGLAPGPRWDIAAGCRKWVLGEMRWNQDARSLLEHSGFLMSTWWTQLVFDCTKVKSASKQKQINAQISR
jgi:hypothetical protein